jgi:hypothetical protein
MDNMAPTDLFHEILSEISAAGGSIPFRRFMDLALYHPNHGYYASGRAGVGKEGDFFTSVSVGSIYGRLLASVCREVWERLGKPSRFTIVEQGANEGRMARDILEEIARSGDTFGTAVKFVIVEPFAVNLTSNAQHCSLFRIFPGSPLLRSCRRSRACIFPTNCSTLFRWIPFYGMDPNGRRSAWNAAVETWPGALDQSPIPNSNRPQRDYPPIFLRASGLR